MEGREEHMEKYLQAPHGNELYVESFSTVQSMQVLKFNDDWSRQHTKAFPWGFHHDKLNTQLHFTHDLGMKLSHLPLSF
jgi:hypothetical protein